eukprot:g1795.t1
MTTVVPVRLEIASDDIDRFCGSNRSLAAEHILRSTDGCLSSYKSSLSIVAVEDDCRGLTVRPVGNPVNLLPEGKNVTYSVALNSEPEADVTVRVTVANSDFADDVSLEPDRLTFTSTDWSQPQSVLVSALLDGAAECRHENVSLLFSPHSRGKYDSSFTEAAHVSLIVEDADAEIVVAPPGGWLNPCEVRLREGSKPVSLRFRVGGEPSAAVTLSLNASADSAADLLLEPSQLVFDTARFASDASGQCEYEKEVAVSARSDGLGEMLFESHSIVVTARSDDPRYNGTIQCDNTHKNFTVRIEDKDTDVRIHGYAGNGTFREGANMSFSVSLGSQPSASSVAIVCDAGRPDRVAFEPSQLSFNDANWNIPQNITLRVLQDGIPQCLYEDLDVVCKATSAGRYNGVQSAPRSIKIRDMDYGVKLSQCAFALQEDTVAPLSVSIMGEPSADVTVMIEGMNEDVGVSESRLVFSKSDFDSSERTCSKTRSVNIEALKDDQGESYHEVNQLVLSAQSDDVRYNRSVWCSTSARVVMVEVEDIDVGLNISGLPGKSQCMREGQNVTLQISLSSQPAQEVNVSMSLTPATGALTPATGDVSMVKVADAQPSAVPASSVLLIFGPSNWHMPQNIALSALDDGIPECLDEQFALSYRATSKDKQSKHNFAASRSVCVKDINAGIRVDSCSVQVKEGETAKVAVRIMGAITADVTVHVESNETEDIELSAKDLVFRPSMFSMHDGKCEKSLVFEVNALADGRGERYNEHATASLKVSSSDSRYDSLALCSVDIQVMDMDAGLIFDGFLRTCSPNNASLPSSFGTSLSLSSFKANTPRTMPKTEIGGIIQKTCDESNQMKMMNTFTDCCIKEGEEQKYTVALSSQPKTSTTVTLESPQDDGVARVALTPTVLTFTSANYQVPQTVKVRALHDGKPRCRHEIVTILHKMQGGDGDARHDNKEEKLNVCVEDTDYGVRLSNCSVYLKEGEEFDVGVEIMGEPAADVTVSLIAEGEGERIGIPEDVHLSQSELVFSVADFGRKEGRCNARQSFTVQALKDGLGELHRERHSLRIEATSDDQRYNRSVECQNAEPAMQDLVVSVEDVDAEMPKTSTTVTLESPQDDGVARVALTPTVLTFTSANYQVPQTVKMQGGDGDARHDNKEEKLNVCVEDTDYGVRLSNCSVYLKEGEEFDVGVEIMGEPAADVTVSLIAEGEGERIGIPEDVHLSQSELVFSVADFGRKEGRCNARQSFTVQALKDGLGELHRERHSLRIEATSDDQRYNRSVECQNAEPAMQDLVVSVEDVDAEMVLCGFPIEADGCLQEGEHAIYQVSLSSQPHPVFLVNDNNDINTQECDENYQRDKDRHHGH